MTILGGVFVADPLYIVLCSGEHEKIQMTAMLASVAAVSDRPVHVFVSMNAALVFRKNLTNDERYQGGPFSNIMRTKNVPDAITLFQQGKMLGEMNMHICSMALDVAELGMDDLVEDIFDGELGLTAFLADAEQGELVML